MYLKFYSLFVGILLCYLSSSAQIVINIINPQQYEAVGNILSIKASIISTYELTNITASTADRQTSLSFNQQSGYFEGSISLVGLHEGDTLNLEVNATDYRNNTQVETRKVIYDLPPIVTVESPLNESVARPTVNIKLVCTDLDTCLLSISFGSMYQSTVVYSGKVKGVLDTTLNLIAFDSSYGSMIINATDARHQTTTETISTIYVETSSLLIEKYTANNKILDFNYDKILVPGDYLLSYPNIIDVNTQQTTVIPLKVQIRELAFLTPYGAIFNGVDSSLYPQVPAFSWGYDWNAGNIYTLGKLNSSLSLKTAGNFAIWSNGPNLYFRNLLNKSDTIISQHAGNWENDVADNGLVAYWNYTYNIASYLNGVTTVLTDNTGDKWNTYVITDGNFIVYRKHDPCCSKQNYALYLYDGQLNYELSNLGLLEPSPLTYYQVNNKFVAYTKLGSSGQTQVWLRDSVGNNIQITFFGTSSTIDYLSSNGDITVLNGGKRILFLRGGASIEITPLGKLYYRDSNYYVAIGRSLFRLDIKGALPLKLISFNAYKNGDINRLQWVTNEEKNTSYFAVERSANGSNFYSIGKVMSYNNNSLVNSYSFTDKAPLAGNNYYRLEMVDKDGKYEISPIRLVTNHPYFNVQILGNPIKDNLSIKISSARPTPLTLTILSSDGKVIRQVNTFTADGSNTKSIETAFLKSGLYYLLVNSPHDGNKYLKFIKH